ncbi:MAG: DUF262 domain-containing protein [Chloroflexi bacterium]|nr:DUF262 domain-containing protein [Chloroflexota bacterium]MCY3589921.1 DUF262 domain-containing protein [Chloroflexota bacterium]MCY3684950.1 DUF262 domain-containing protein [Chloroflexota bacterium]MDE2707604.1 DUF262 domain-containing protein [Chloroflexota bacterium]
MTDLRFEFYLHPRAKIHELVGTWHRMDFEPEYQRKAEVWKLDKKQYFIDSIINGMDLTKLYFHQLPPSDPRFSVSEYAVIDGKQRLQAIRDFVQGQYPLSTDFKYLHAANLDAAGATYQDLLNSFPELRGRFDSTEMPIVVMRTSELDLIEEMFIRLNQQENLNAPERRNALRGPIPLQIREFAEHRFFTTFLPFPDRRYNHRDIAAKFLWISHEDRFVSTKRSDLDQLVISYRASPQRTPSVEELRQRSEEVADAMCEFFEPKDSLLKGIGWITLFYHLFRLARHEGLPDGVTRGRFERFMERITSMRRIQRELAAGQVADPTVRVDPQLAAFDRHRQALNDAGALRSRYTILSSYFQSRHGVELPAITEEET